MVFLGPLVDRAVVLDWAELAILFFYKKEVCSIRTPRFPDSSPVQVFRHKFVDFLYFELGEGEQPSRKGARCAREEFNGVVLDRMGGKPLGLLFAKDFCMALVMSRDFLAVGGFFWGV